MNVYTSLDELPTIPHAFAIGTFDGVHRGHQLLLRKLQSFHRPTAVLTFPTHPLQHLRPPAPPSIVSLERKLSLLSAIGIDSALVIEFSTIAGLTYDELLLRLPLSHLVRGKGSAFGKNRGGTEENIRLWGLRNNVHIEYIDLLAGVNSSQIRAAISSGDYNKANYLLGHQYV